MKKILLQFFVMILCLKIHLLAGGCFCPYVGERLKKNLSCFGYGRWSFWRNGLSLLDICGKFWFCLLVIPTGGTLRVTLTVCCTSYNLRELISDAVESMLLQDSLQNNYCQK